MVDQGRLEWVFEEEWLFEKGKGCSTSHTVSTLRELDECGISFDITVLDAPLELHVGPTPLRTLRRASCIFVTRT